MNLYRQSSRRRPGTELSILLVLSAPTILESLKPPSRLSRRLFCSPLKRCFAAVESIASASVQFPKATNRLNLLRVSAVCFGSSSETGGGGGTIAGRLSAQR